MLPTRRASLPERRLLCRRRARWPGSLRRCSTRRLSSQVQMRRPQGQGRPLARPPGGLMSAAPQWGQGRVGLRRVRLSRAAHMAARRARLQ